MPSTGLSRRAAVASARQAQLRPPPRFPLAVFRSHPLRGSGAKTTHRVPPERESTCLLSRKNDDSVLDRPAGTPPAVLAPLRNVVDAGWPPCKRLLNCEKWKGPSPQRVLTPGRQHLTGSGTDQPIQPHGAISYISMVLEGAGFPLATDTMEAPVLST